MIVFVVIVLVAVVVDMMFVVVLVMLLFFSFCHLVISWWIDVCVTELVACCHVVIFDREYYRFLCKRCCR